MTTVAALRLIPLTLALAGAAVVIAWSAAPTRLPPIVQRLPGDDHAGQTKDAPKPVDLHGAFLQGAGRAADLPGSWPRFRGANFDNISPDPLALPAYPESGPARAWIVDVGEGYAGPAVLHGRVYLLDYDVQHAADVLRCLSLNDGKEIWSRSYPCDVKRNHGMSRTTPAVTDRFVVTIGPRCDVLCADARTGEYRWGIDLVAEYKTKVPPWYTGQCPLIDSDRAILAPGGDALMIAVDCASGRILWKTPNPHSWEMTHSSIIPMTLAGRRMYVYCSTGGAVGVSPDDGSVLWHSSAWKIAMATVPSPLQVGDDRIFFSGGYGAGAMMARIKRTGEQFTLEPIYRLPPEVFGAEQQTPILYNGLIYGVIPSGQLVCLDPQTGKQRWNSSSQHFGIGPFLVAGDQLFLLNDTGKLTIARISPDAFSALGTWSVLDHGRESWGPMALAGDRLILRDTTRLECLNLLEAQP